MEWIERRGEKFRIKFRYSGRNFQVMLGTDDGRVAERDLARFEENLRLLERGRLTLPEGADIGRFLLFDGRLGKNRSSPRASPWAPSSIATSRTSRRVPRRRRPARPSGSTWRI